MFDVSQVIMLDNRKLTRHCQLYLNKTGRKKIKFKINIYKLKKLCEIKNTVFIMRTYCLAQGTLLNVLW